MLFSIPIMRSSRPKMNSLGLFLSYYAVAAMLLMVLIAPACSAEQQIVRNEVKVTIAYWFTNGFVKGNSTDLRNVSFQIAFDTNNDGVYENVNESGVFHSVNHLMSSPYSVSLIAPDYLTNITLKVRVIDHTPDGLVDMNFGNKGTQVIQNTNESTQLYAFDAADVPGAGPESCGLSFSYSVLTIDPTISRTSAVDSGLQMNLDIFGYLVSGLLITSAILIVAFTIVFRRKKKELHESHTAASEVVKGFEKILKGSYCAHCGSPLPKEGISCPNCGWNKP